MDQIELINLLLYLNTLTVCKQIIDIKLNHLYLVAILEAISLCYLTNEFWLFLKRLPTNY